LNIVGHTLPAGHCAAGISNVNVTQQHLMRAGIRLSNIIDQMFSGNGCATSADGGNRAGSKKNRSKKKSND